MKTSPFKKILTVSAVLFLAVFAYRRLVLTEEDRIMAVFQQVEEALEARDSSGCLSVISSEYHDSTGRRRGDIRNLLLVFCRVAHEVMVNIARRSLTVRGDSAEVELTVSARVSRGAQNIQVKTEEGSQTVIVNLRKEGGRWMVTSAVFPDDIERWLGALTRF
ncbi:MAG: hypothetical protein HYU36_06085 [Planctomycetes bacterium]|nr:hypothetical protein [Planctomycetota bacterium]